MFYRTVFTIEVLSCGRLGYGIPLNTVVYAITEGDCSGSVERVSEDEVDGPTMARLLQAQGSEPMFLGLTEDGQEADE